LEGGVLAREPFPQRLVAGVAGSGGVEPGRRLSRFGFQPGREALVRHRGRVLLRPADDALPVRVHLAAADAAHLLSDGAIRRFQRHWSCATRSLAYAADMENRSPSLAVPRVFNREDGIIIQQSQRERERSRGPVRKGGRARKSIYTLGRI